MNFFKFLLKFTLGGFAICLLFGPAATLVYGIIVVVVRQIRYETSRMKTPEGRAQIRRESERQKAIEKEFGTVEYWENK